MSDIDAHVERAAAADAGSRPRSDRILLVRHGESTANVAAALAERSGAEVIPVEARDADVPLSHLGRSQAETLAETLRAELGGHPFDTARIWSSPYRRALETARIAMGIDDARDASDERPTPGIAVDERLRDRELGILDALTSIGVERRLPDEAARRRWLGKFFYRPPGGESWNDVALRVRSFLHDAHVGDARPVLVFAHDAVVSLFAYVLLEFDEARLTEFLAERVVANASITSFARQRNGGWVLEAFADARHVEAAGVPRTEHTGTGVDE